VTEASRRIFLHALGDDYLPVIQQGLEWIGLRDKVKWGDTVFIKPNLTFPVFRKGVMTNPACVEAIVKALKDYTDDIIVGEADSGGYNPFNIDEVLEKTGIKSLVPKYGIRVVNLSRLPYRSIEFSYKGRLVSVPFSNLLLDEINLFVTAPVPKIHMNSGISMAVKNQWGCIPEPAVRLKLHPVLEKVLYEINKRLQPFLAIVDGKYGLNRSGPMQGDAVELDWLMVAEDPYAADLAACHLMQINPRKIYYLRYRDREENSIGIEDITFSQDWRPFVREKFFLVRKWTDYPGLLAFRSRFWAYVAYYSPISGILHKLLYLFREPFYDYEEPGSTKQ
jgi:uncharacterized protein (DUF362 family)